MQKNILFLIFLIFYWGCSYKNNNIPIPSNEKINISKSKNFLFYAYLKNGVKLIKISKKLLPIEKNEEVIRVYKNSYYPVYDIFSKGIGCYTNKTYRTNSFCSSMYIKNNTPVQDTVLNSMGSVLGLTIANGFNYHKVFDNKKFKQAIIKSKLPLIKKYIDNNFDILYISKIKIDIPNKNIDNIQIASISNKDILLVYNKNNYLKGIVKTYDLKEKDLFEATSILTQRLMKVVIQHKMENETTKEYIERQNRVSLARNYFINIAMQSLIGNIKLENLKYNADEKLMYAVLKSNHNYKESIRFKMPRDRAMEFKRKGNYSFQLTFQYKNNKILLKRIEIDNYLAQQSSYSTHTIDEPTYKPPKIPTKGFIDDLPNLLAKIPQVSKNTKKWLFVIGIEEYDNTDSVTYSKRSAKTFVKVAKKTLGVIDRNSYELIGNNATSGTIKDRLKLMLRNIKKGDSIYFYYSGHGIPVLPNREPYILPKDRVPDLIKESTFFKVNNIYTLLANSKANKIIVIMDSCFTGATDAKSVFKGKASVVLAPKRVTFNHNKMVVITAGGAKQFSNMYSKKGHRLFSYFLMKALLEGNRNIGEIYRDIFPKVHKVSLSFGDLNEQNITIEGNEQLSF